MGRIHLFCIYYIRAGGQEVFSVGMVEQGGLRAEISLMQEKNHEPLTVCAVVMFGGEYDTDPMSELRKSLCGYRIRGSWYAISRNDAIRSAQSLSERYNAELYLAGDDELQAIVDD